MINKMQVGSRISSLRRAAGYTQTSFAERLGVSPQAVSKWENGVALPDVEILLSISQMFMLSINEVLEGNNIIPKLTNRPFTTTDGIAYFLPEDERNYTLEYSVEAYGEEMVSWAKRMIAEGWVRRNWMALKDNKTRHLEVAKRILEHGGLILELGAGPGGGYMPRVLLENSDANIIISDYSPTVVREWKKLFDVELNPPNTHYAVLDNCDLPFADCSIDVVSCAGFKNTMGDQKQAIMEIYRVLKPGGLYVSGDGFVTQETLKSLPEEAQKVLLEKRPDILEDFFEISTTAGFKKIDTLLGGGWWTDDDESEIATLARELGINLRFTSFTRFCTK